jgi:hypothetical protein
MFMIIHDVSVLQYNSTLTKMQLCGYQPTGRIEKTSYDNVIDNIGQIVELG